MNKYIIYQGSGGLVHLLGGLVYCCNYINKKKNYLLIIDIKNHIGFGNNFSKYFKLKHIKYSEDYNDIKNTNNYYKISLNYYNENNVIYDRNNGYIHRNDKYLVNIGQSLEKIGYYKDIKMYAGNGGNNHRNIIKYVRCNDNILQKLKEYKFDSKYIGVHFRNTDRINNINIFIDNLKKTKSKYKDYKIYIATDDIKALKIFKNKFKDIFNYFEPFDANGENIHFNDPDKDKMIMSILIDMYMLYHCDIFIDSPNSLVSKLIKLMRNNNESIFS